MFGLVEKYELKNDITTNSEGEWVTSMLVAFVCRQMQNHKPNLSASFPWILRITQLLICLIRRQDVLAIVIASSYMPGDDEF